MQAWGATVYVKKIDATVYCESGAASCVAVTADDTSGDLEGALSAAGENGTLNICAGTFTDADLDSDTILHTTATGQTINGVGVVNLIATATRAIRIQHTGLTINNIASISGGGTASVEVQLPVAALTITNTNITSTGSGVIGLYVGAAVTTLTLTNVNAENCTGKGFFSNVAMGGTVQNCRFNLNASYGADGLLGGVLWLNSEFSNNQGHGFYAHGNTDSGIIRGCTATVNYLTASSEDRHGFTLADGTDDWIIERSTASGDLAVDIQASSGTNTGHIVRNNILIGVGAGETEDGTGLYLGANNASYENSGLQIYNNTIISRDVNGAALFLGQYNNANNAIKNNILVNEVAGYIVETSATLGAYQTMDFNCYYSSGADKFRNQGADQSFAAWKTASSGDAHSINSDPLFRSATDFHLQPSSPCIYTGTDVSLTSDFDGLPIRGSAPNIGAYESWPKIF
jgi:hypothetical protein